MNLDQGATSSFPRDPRFGNTPITVRGGRHVFWVPARYAKVAALAGRNWTQRDLAQATGYSLTGLREAIKALERLGIIVVKRVRGCFGHTRFTLQRDAVLPNVLTTVRSLIDTLKASFSMPLARRPLGIEDTRTVVRTFAGTGS